MASCSSSQGLKMDAVEKEKLRGFHAKQAKKIIDDNESNKSANKKAAEKSKTEQNEHLNALNKNKSKANGGNTRTFGFY